MTQADAIELTQFIETLIDVKIHESKKRVRAVDIVSGTMVKAQMTEFLMRLNITRTPR